MKNGSFPLAFAIFRSAMHFSRCIEITNRCIPVPSMWKGMKGSEAASRHKTKIITP